MTDAQKKPPNFRTYEKIIGLLIGGLTLIVPFYSPLFDFIIYQLNYTPNPPGTLDAEYFYFGIGFITLIILGLHFLPIMISGFVVWHFLDDQNLNLAKFSLIFGPLIAGLAFLLQILSLSQPLMIGLTLPVFYLTCLMGVVFGAVTYLVANRFRKARMPKR